MYTKKIPEFFIPDPFDGIESIAVLYESMNRNNTRSFWQIGNFVNSMFENDLTESCFHNAAGKIGITSRELMKACRFADKYSQKHLARILGLKYSVDWPTISKGMIFDAENIVSQMEKCFDADDYCRYLENKLFSMKNTKVYTVDTYTKGFKNIIGKIPFTNIEEYKSQEEEIEALRSQLSHKDRIIYIYDEQSGLESCIMIDNVKYIGKLERDLIAMKKIILKGGTIDDILPLLPIIPD